MLFSVALSCGAWASEESTTIEWSTHHYLDADGNVKGDTVIVNHPNVAGFCTLSEDEMYAAYLRVRIDGEHADLCISVDNETFYVWTEDPVFTVNVYASSALSASFTGTITEGSSLISLDADARDFIVQDMRMLSGETVIEIPTSDGFGFIIVLPHDGNFRDLYDMENARQWYEEPAAQSGDGSQTASVTPEFKAKVDEYYQHFREMAASVENSDIQSGVGVLDTIILGAQVWNDYQEFKELGESATTQADKDYYEGIRNQVLVFLSTSAFGAYINNK